MKYRFTGAIAVVVAVAIWAPTASIADSTPSPSPSTAPSPPEAIDQYRIALEQYRAELSLREQDRKIITQNFIAAVIAANSVAKTAMRSAKTADTKSVILAQQKSSIALATSVRDAAITAMGPAPLEPIKPVKQVKAAPTKKVKPESPTPTPKK